MVTGRGVSWHWTRGEVQRRDRRQSSADSLSGVSSHGSAQSPLRVILIFPPWLGLYLREYNFEA
jgi:hypothetical protein